jgi:DMSO/TMAO reductase YedYZ molybdopterin-dependent catalytic subunit
MLIAVLAVVSALGAGHFVAAFVGRTASPFLAVADAVVRLTPQGLVTWAERDLGTHDKLTLELVMAAVLLGLACVTGLVSRRNALPGQVIVVAVGLLGVVAVYQRQDLGQLALLAPVAGLVAGLGVFTWLHRRLLPRASPRTPGGLDRRAFLRAGAGVAAGAGALALAGEVVGTGKDAEGSRAAVGALVPSRTAPPVPADADFAKLGTPTFLTPNGSFYRIDTALVVPQVRAEDWSLRVHGMVDREVVFRYADIRERPLVERIVTLTCVSNEVGGRYISTANWLGVDLADLLNEAGVRGGAEQLFATSVDGFTSGTPVSVAMDPDRGAMLAIGMNGQPLPVEHGFPARLVVPGLYGYVSATKWVTDLELTTWDARQAYWLRRGWAEQAPIKTESRIDRPKPSDTVSEGRVTVCGVAWAQHTGVDRVEVRLDQGPWQQAELSAEVTKDAWRMWWTGLQVAPGTHEVAVRATDRSGYPQTEQPADTVPDGATGWHTIAFTAR